MKKIIKRISLLLAAFSVLAVASACGIGGGKGDSASSVKESSAEASSFSSVSDEASEATSEESEEEPIYSGGADLEWDWFE